MLLTAAVPPPLTWQRAVLGWRLAPLAALLVLLAAVLYLHGVRRLRRAGGRWPAGRTAGFLGGLGVVVVATQSGLAAYDVVLFSVHMAQHMLLAMAAPLLLALGAPVTLLLRAGSRRVRRATARVLHARALRVLLHPSVGWVLFVVSPFVLYFTPLFEASLRSTLLHELVHAHLLLTGAVFLVPLVGADPVPRRPAYGTRLLGAVLTLPFHAFLGVSIMGSTRLLARDWYLGLERRWGASPIADQNAGGALLWAAGDLVGLALVGLLVVQWMRSDVLVAAREDRRGDDADRAAAGLPGA
jgi:putative copper resistance protein D